ncbi:hypothetical protein A3H77_00150 [Candidatus Kaiserbacteria bacterium RIFCSPLOWO2_02_FULL_56_11]|uniref:Uncharacterized protein n=2 Tax=Candidatus Kaiseribacteriota TaxID=1752734 RepID=A0A1F6E573_9BACT|nr:MAG: hypothetical protein A3C95_01930 [Candidatus Kaiserbacteria bacterium RIFCSPHIGHO2_02_FULL_56_30]OGG72158.1 MAG: hypothetical protein A3E65_02160 [Candidatus Kaiserbacteria bacterium RIFCSPHIGHO2_12_FULL_56_13]OGG81093.1 MAG: hypothetical protein A3H77_00150 [Candidatus Kaiserbacteria bacterium RIFCSPLOWO2_02_FULL_56_11]
MHYGRQEIESIVRALIVFYFFMNLKPHKVGITLGAFVGLIHVVWSVIVALGWGQGLVDFIVKIHMVEVTHTVLPFDIWSAIMLVIVTAAVGYVFGHVFALVWNRLAR